MLKIVTVVYTAIALAILLVEDSADGVADKKAAAIKHVDEILTSAGYKRPALLTDAVLGSVIDVLVALLNKAGIFRKAA